MAAAQVDQGWQGCIHSLSSGDVPSAAQLSSLCSSTGRLDVLASVVYDHFEDKLAGQLIKPFWQQLQAARSSGSSIQQVLLQPLQELAHAVDQQSQQLAALTQQLLMALLQAQQQQQQQQSKQQQQQDVPASTVALLASLCDRHRMAVTSLMMATAPFSLPGLLQQYYSTKLHELCAVIQQLQEQQQAQAGGDDSDDMSEDAALFSPSTDQPQQQPRAEQQQQQQQQEPDPLPVLGEAWAQELSGVAGCLERLGLGPASEEAYTRVINSYVLERLRGLATQEFDAAVLPRAQHLVCAGPLAFLRLVLVRGAAVGAAAGGGQDLKLQEWRLRLTYLLLETLGLLRSGDMFDIVVDYPDSAPALSDLAACLQHTSLAGHFAGTFRGALQARLLHAGAATSDIIHTYVCTIRAMQQVDSNGLLLELVSEPIRAYLRSRPDTIRCIVSMLTEEPADSAAAAGGGEGGAPGASLLEELQQQQQQASSQHGGGLSAGGAGGGMYAAAGGAAAAAAGGYGLAAAVAAATAGGGSVSSGAAAAASAAAHASYNWSVGEAEGDEAALRLLESLEAGPAAAAATGSSSGNAAAAAAAASGGSRGQQQQAGTLLGLPLTPAGGGSAALAGCSLAARGGGDVVSMLIGIYGGPLLFMEEYRRMLADRLLCKEEYECVREIRTLELLKIRFGEAGLHACEVLLKDMADSKRLDANIRALHPQAPLPPAVSAALSRCRATVASYLFWPELPEHELLLPPDLQTALEVYAERFRHLKAPRKLHWRATLGLVELSLTVGDGEPLDFRVTPVHAALLLQFADKNNNSSSSDGGFGAGGAPRPSAAAAVVQSVASPGGDMSSPPQQQQQSSAAGAGVVSWKTASQLSSALGVPVSVVRRKAMFWVAAGVLLERRGPKGEAVYSRATRIDPSRIGSREASDYSWKEASGPAASPEDRLAAEMGPFENYIMGMLTNFGALPCERLHNMLRVFVVGEPKYEGRSQEQLGAFLGLLVEAGKLEVNNGIYSRHKGGPQGGGGGGAAGGGPQA